MDIRLSKEEEKSQVRRIWEYCFSDSSSYVDYYFNRKFSSDNVMVLEVEDDLISSIHLNQHTIMLNEKNVDVSYVVGVSTLPEARGKGVMKDLMVKSLYEMKNRNQYFSILMPIDFRLYTGFGYANCYDMLNQSMDIFDLRKFRIVGDFKSAKIEDSEELLDIYISSVQRNNGYSIRSQRYFEELVEEMSVEGGYVYINYIEGKPVGYIAYSIENSTMIVREIYYKDINSYKSMLKFIFNHNTQCKKVEIISSIDNPLRHMLDNPKDANFEIKPFMMARILDVDTFINSLEFKVKNDKVNPVYIEVIDDNIVENNGIYELYIEDMVIKSKKLRTASDNADESIISLSIGELTQLFTGYRTLEEIMFCKNSDKDLIEYLRIFDFDKNTNHINEYV